MLSAIQYRLLEHAKRHETLASTFLVYDWTFELSNLYQYETDLLIAIPVGECFQQYSGGISKLYPNNCTKNVRYDNFPV